MPTHVLAAVLLAALLHATWNALAKGYGGGDPLLRASLIAAGGAAVSLPLLASAGMPAAASYPHLAASVAIHVVYFVLVGLTLRGADLTVVYPLTRGAAPLGTALAGTFFLGESLNVTGWTGVLVLSAGIVLLGARALVQRGLDARGALLVALNATVIVSYTIVDGAGVRLAHNSVGYIAALMLGTGVCMLPVAAMLVPGKLAREARANWLFGLCGGGLLTASYGIALWAMTVAPVAAVSATRETSVLFAAAIGVIALGEPVGLGRALGAALICLGLVLLRLA
jgi:drug/metabolite transporter (DMT)-like permease